MICEDFISEIFKDRESYIKSIIPHVESVSRNIKCKKRKNGISFSYEGKWFFTIWRSLRFDLSLNVMNNYDDGYVNRIDSANELKGPTDRKKGSAHTHTIHGEDVQKLIDDNDFDFCKYIRMSYEHECGKILSA